MFSDKTFGAFCSVASDKRGLSLFAVDDFTFLKLKHRGSDVFIFDAKGRTQARFGRSGLYKGHTSWYQDLAFDKDENIYTVDLLNNTIQKFKRVSNF